MSAPVIDATHQPPGYTGRSYADLQADFNANRGTNPDGTPKKLNWTQAEQDYFNSVNSISNNPLPSQEPGPNPSGGAGPLGSGDGNSGGTNSPDSSGPGSSGGPNDPSDFTDPSDGGDTSWVPSWVSTLGGDVLKGVEAAGPAILTWLWANKSTILKDGATALGAYDAYKATQDANTLKQQAIASAQQAYGTVNPDGSIAAGSEYSRAPFRVAGQNRALGAVRPDLSTLFADPSNPYARSGHVPSVGSFAPTADPTAKPPVIPGAPIPPLGPSGTSIDPQLPPGTINNNPATGGTGFLQSSIPAVGSKVVAPGAIPPPIDPNIDPLTGLPRVPVQVVGSYA